MRDRRRDHGRTLAARYGPTPLTEGGDADYSPLVKITNAGAGGFIYNAPSVAFDDSVDQLNAFCDGEPDYALVHDKVLEICPRDQSVTLTLTPGFSFAKPVLYLNTKASRAEEH